MRSSGCREVKLKTCLYCCWIGSPLVYGMKVLLVGDLLQESDCLGQDYRTESSPHILPSLSLICCHFILSLLGCPHLL